MLTLHLESNKAYLKDNVHSLHVLTGNVLDVDALIKLFNDDFHTHYTRETTHVTSEFKRKYTP
jgi:hypothetical protein